jgi:hypothetical protein
MSRAITVKVATPKVIKALEAKLEKTKTDFANQDRLEAEYQEQHKSWNESLTKYAMSKLSEAKNIRTSYRAWNNTLNIGFDVDTKGAEFPDAPERNFVQIHRHIYEEMVEDITNALNILRMTDEETVNASTMKQIARYL